MDVGEEMIVQIKGLCSLVTEDTYDSVIQQGRDLLCGLRDLGMEQEKVYQLLLQYHGSMKNSLSRDCMGDILDFAAGWCSPQMKIWQD